jgi:hypothetical protein
MGAWIWTGLLPLALLTLLAVCAAMARLGGWGSLALRYRAGAEPEGTTFRMQSARFGWVDYNGCLKVVVARAGLYLAPFPLFRFGHPPLLIPWSDLHVLEVRQSRWAQDVRVAVGRPEVAQLRLPLRVVEAARGLLPGALPGNAGEAVGPEPT